MKHPYSDVSMSSDTLIRVFDDLIDPIELTWHRDDEDRSVVAVGQTDWQIQLENELPKDLAIPVFIERGQWHRLIKGNNSLTIKIIKIIHVIKLKTKRIHIPLSARLL